MLALATILAVALVASIGGTAAVRHVASAHGALDRADSSRKTHARPVPALGGIGILAGCYGALGVALLVPALRQAVLSDGRRLAALAAAGLIVAALGVADDLRGVGARRKLAVQLAVAALLYAAGFRIELIDNPLGEDVRLGALSLPLTLLWMAGVSNAMNLVDGLDGLAGGLSLAGAAAIFCVAALGGDLPAMAVAAAVAGAVLGFLVFNVHPASIFMGDTGSLFLGTALGALATRPQAHLGNGVPLVAMIVVLGVPIADTLLAIARRAAAGAPIFAADREHLHHRLIDAGLSHRDAVAVLWLAAALLAAAGVHLASGAGLALAVLVAVAVGGAAALGRLGMLTLARPSQRHRREVNRARLRTVRAASRRLRHATAISEVRALLAVAAPGLAARSLSLYLGTGPPWPGAPAVAGRSCLPLDSGRPGLGALEIAWADATARLDRDAEIALEILCRAVTSSVDRLARGYVRAGWPGGAGARRPAA